MGEIKTIEARADEYTTHIDTERMKLHPETNWDKVAVEYNWLDIDNAYTKGAQDQKEIDEGLFEDFLNGLKCGNIWEGRGWRYVRLWKEYKEFVKENGES